MIRHLKSCQQCEGKQCPRCGKLRCIKSFNQAKREVCHGCCVAAGQNRRYAGANIGNKAAIARFFSHVEIHESGCWLWTGGVRDPDDGYGRLKIHGKTIYAHRFSYELHKGAIPEGMILDHLCHTQRCVNPDHLEIVSRLENIRRGYVHNRQVLGQSRKCMNWKRLYGDLYKQIYGENTIEQDWIADARQRMKRLRGES